MTASRLPRFIAAEGGSEGEGMQHHSDGVTRRDVLIGAASGLALAAVERCERGAERRAATVRA